jgi:hypothetical protein
MSIAEKLHTYWEKIDNKTFILDDWEFTSFTPIDDRFAEVTEGTFKNKRTEIIHFRGKLPSSYEFDFIFNLIQ